MSGHGTCRPPLTVSVERGSEWLHSGRSPESGGHKRRSSDPTAKRFCRERRDGTEPNVCTYNARTQHTTVIVYKPLKRLVRKRREGKGAKPGLFATDV